MSKVQQAVTSFKGGFNCSQAILSAYAESLGLDREAALKVAAGFGGGMGCMGGVCGAVTGAFMVLGLKHGSATPGDKAAKELTYAQVREFTRRFEALHHHIACRGLLGCDISKAEWMQAAKDQKLFTTKCPKFVEDAAKILQEVLGEPEDDSAGVTGNVKGTVEMPGVVPNGLHWEITETDIAKVKAFFDCHKDKWFVKHRIQKNVDGPRPTFSQEAFWHVMIACLLTTRQKSGPKSAVQRLIQQEPFPLAFSICNSAPDVEALVLAVLERNGGIRRTKTIAKEVSENLRRLNGGLWAGVEAAWGRLAAADDPVLEREIARVFDRELRGFGPKQARNLLQAIGLTKYEIPLDSRFSKWLKESGMAFELPDSALLAAKNYERVLDSVQELARKCGVLPCVLDAAIFASFDGDGWDGMKMIW